MTDIKRPLITSNRGVKGLREFQKEFQDCEMRYNRIKNKNDVIQKTSDNDLDRDIIKEIKSQGHFIETETKQLYTKISLLKKQYRDPQSQNRLKALQQNLGKQIERNKAIMARYINRVSSSSFLRGRGSSSFFEDEEEGKESPFIRIQPNSNGSNRPQQMQKMEGAAQSEGQYLQSAELDRTIQKEKLLLLNDLQNRMNNINKIMNGMAVEVNEQGDDMNAIDDHLGHALSNAERANDEVEEAEASQKKAKKKYIWVALLVFIIAVAIGGVVYFLNT